MLATGSCSACACACWISMLAKDEVFANSRAQMTSARTASCFQHTGMQVAGSSTSRTPRFYRGTGDRPTAPANQNSSTPTDTAGIPAGSAGALECWCAGTVPRQSAREWPREHRPGSRMGVAIQPHQLAQSGPRWATLGSQGGWSRHHRTKARTSRPSVTPG